MICKISCLISLVFIISTIYFTLSVDKQDINNKYVNNLTDTQLIKYKKIVDERKKISITGYVLGLCLSISLILLNYFVFKLDIKLTTCIVGAITFLTHYFFYILSPKSDWMILHLKEDQMKDWLYVYKNMQYNYHLSFVVGIIATMILAYSFKCS
jgi:hypothetical protein